MRGGAKASAFVVYDAARCKATARSCNFNYGCQRVSLIAGSRRRAHPTSSHFDSDFFLEALQMATDVVARALLLPDSIPLRVISGDFLRGAPGRREGKGRKEEE